MEIPAAQNRPNRPSFFHWRPPAVRTDARIHRLLRRLDFRRGSSLWRMDSTENEFLSKRQKIDFAGLKNGCLPVRKRRPDRCRWRFLDAGNESVLIRRKTLSFAGKRVSVVRLFKINSNMDGYTFENDCGMTTLSDSVISLVLFGRTGNGKSATGNSILGGQKFISMRSLSSVTATCESAQTLLHSGQIVNVIDTPGLFHSSVSAEFIIKEIVKCITMSKDGIHAVLVVSLTNRFSVEEMAAYQTLRSIFGADIVNYMIVVLTGGDVLEEVNETLDDYLGPNCPQALKELILLCNNRYVLFDNKTKDETKKASQVEKLPSLVEGIVMANGGQPYTNENFQRLQEREAKVHSLSDSLKSPEENPREIVLLMQQIERSYKEQLDRVISIMEECNMDTIFLLESKVAQEESARKQAEQYARDAQMHSDEEARKLRGSIKSLKQETEHLRGEVASKCTIL